eukprot:838525-Amphidinium_carterae.1
MSGPLNSVSQTDVQLSASHSMLSHSVPCQSVLTQISLCGSSSYSDSSQNQHVSVSATQCKCGCNPTPCIDCIGSQPEEKREVNTMRTQTKVRSEDRNKSDYESQSCQSNTMTVTRLAIKQQQQQQQQQHQQQQPAQGYNAQIGSMAASQIIGGYTLGAEAERFTSLSKVILHRLLSMTQGESHALVQSLIHTA